MTCQYELLDASERHTPFLHHVDQELIGSLAFIYQAYVWTATATHPQNIYHYKMEMFGEWLDDGPEHHCRAAITVDQN